MAAATVQSSTNLFRRLAWNATVSLEIRLGGSIGTGAPVDRYYIHAPRYTYLALLLPSIKENLLELALDDDELAKLDETQWWFEEDGGESEHFAAQGPCKWHWAIDLIELHAAIAHTVPRAAPPNDLGPSTVTPLKLVLHLSAPPAGADKLPPGGVPAGVEAAKTHFVNQVKEADFVRWGNTKRVTGLRRADLEAGWEGVLAGDFDVHGRMASRVVPLPVPVTTAGNSSTPPVSGSGGSVLSTSPGSGVPSRPPSTEPGASSSAAKPESVYAARSLPIKLYLPDGAPALQQVVPPLGADGQPTTLLTFLRNHLPLLFKSTASSNPYADAQPIAQGIVLPPDAEVAWLTACMAGADGWLRIGIRLVGE